MNSFDQQVQQFITNETKTLKEAWRLQKLLNECYEIINDFHVHINSLDETSREMQEQYDKYGELEDKMHHEIDKYNDEISDELYKNYELYSLDLVAYDDDVQDFFAQVDDLSKKMDNGRKPVIDHYNKLIKNAGDVYRRVEECTKLLTDFFDDQHLLDSSISDSFKDNEANRKDYPVYIVEPGNKMIKTYRNALGIWANSGRKTMTFEVVKDIVQFQTNRMYVSFLYQPLD